MSVSNVNNRDDTVKTPRRSSRERKLTEKAEDLVSKHLKSFEECYTKWKHCAKDSRTQLKSSLAEAEFDEIIASLKFSQGEILNIYENIKLIRPPTRQEVQRVDCVTQITQDICEVVHSLRKQDEFNPEITKMNIRTRLPKEDNPSVFGESDTETHLSRMLSQTSIRSAKSSEHSEAVANLATKVAQVSTLKEIQAQTNHQGPRRGAKTGPPQSSGRG